MTTMTTMDMDLKTWAIAGAEGFEKVWQVDNFWRRSNTLHGFLRFVRAAETCWGAADPALQAMQSLLATMLDTNVAYFKGAIGKSNVWADDYGWCGVACVEAWSYLESIGKPVDAGAYMGLATACWRQMRDQGYDESDSATPVPHGCSNRPPDPKEGGDTKNTVTNVNFLLLSLRLFAATGASAYLQWAYSQYQWFAAWFAATYESLDDGPYLRTRYWAGLPAPVALIHERPMAKDSYTTRSYPAWEPGWVWTADQGLMLIALAELLSVKDKLGAALDAKALVGFDPARFVTTVRETLTQIADGIKSLLFSDADNVLREAPFKSSFTSDPRDYVCGRGVLLRCASEATVRVALGSTFFPDGVRATAAAVWNSRVSQHRFDSLWNKSGDQAFNAYFRDKWGTGDLVTEWKEVDEGVVQATGLDALTAAMRLSAS